MRAIRPMGIAVVLAGLLGTWTTTVRSEDFAEDVIVIVNKRDPVADVAIADLKKIYLGQIATWSNGKPVFAINAVEGTDLRERWRAMVLGMSQDGEDRHWQAMASQLQGQKPRELVDPVRAVFRAQGAVAYVPRSALKGRDIVRIVLTIPRSGRK
jgi:hypothetical protein